jgi:hypothetical protein
MVNHLFHFLFLLLSWCHTHRSGSLWCVHTHTHDTIATILVVPSPHIVEDCLLEEDFLSYYYCRFRPHSSTSARRVPEYIRPSSLSRGALWALPSTHHTSEVSMVPNLYSRSYDILQNIWDKRQVHTVYNELTQHTYMHAYMLVYMLACMPYSSADKPHKGY